jgi:hypothetical protein
VDRTIHAVKSYRTLRESTTQRLQCQQASGRQEVKTKSKAFPVFADYMPAAQLATTNPHVCRRLPFPR